MASPFRKKVLFLGYLFFAAGGFASPGDALPGPLVGSAATILEQADAYYEDDDWERAAEGFRKVVEADPDSHHAWARLGWSLYELDRLEEAEASLETAVSIKPLRAWYRYALGRVYRMREHYDEARNEQLKALEIKPGYYYPRYELARVESAQHQESAALDWIEEALEIDGTRAWGWEAKGRILARMNRLCEAEAAFEEAIRREESPEWNFRYRLAKVKTWRRQYDSALYWARQASAIDGAAFWPAKQIGQIYEDQGRFEEALDAYRDATLLDPKRETGWRDQVFVLREMGRYDEALDVLEEGLSSVPGNAKLLAQKGITLLDMGDLPGAETSLLRAVESDPNHAFAWRWLGRTRIRRGDSAGALKALDRAIDLDPRDVWNHAAKADLDRDKPELAFGELSNWLDVEHGFDDLGAATHRMIGLGYALEAERLLRDRKRDVPCSFHEDLSLVRALLAQGKEEEARQVLDEVLPGWEARLEENPLDSKLLIRVGYAHALGREDEKTREVVARLTDGERPLDSGRLYDAGCMLALIGDADGAFDVLADAVSAGFSAESAWPHQDWDLSSLRGDSRFELMFGSDGKE